MANRTFNKNIMDHLPLPMRGFWLRPLDLTGLDWADEDIVPGYFLNDQFKSFPKREDVRLECGTKPDMDRFSLFANPVSVPNVTGFVTHALVYSQKAPGERVPIALIDLNGRHEARGGSFNLTWDNALITFRCGMMDVLDGRVASSVDDESPVDPALVDALEGVWRAHEA